MDPKLKSLSMGLQWNILRIFGSIPGPIALGAMLDGACSVWQYICGEQGACWIYDDDKIYKAVMIVRKSKTAQCTKYRRLWKLPIFFSGGNESSEYILLW